MSELEKKIDKLFDIYGEESFREALNCAWYYDEYGSKDTLKSDKNKILALISHERAEAVRDLLAQLGINEDSLQANGYYAIAISKEELEEYLSNERVK